MMKRELCTFPLAPRQLQVLQKAGFVHDEDLKDLSPTQLKNELDVTVQEALDILNVVFKTSPSTNTSSTQSTSDNPKEKSAYDLLKEEEEDVPIVTFCAELDDMIGGGIPIGKITEICGAPGMGKTQFGIQLAVDAQIPEAYGGVGGEAVFIDCEGSFIIERVLQIAKAAHEHIQNVAQCDSQPENKQVMETFTVNNILNGIHVYRCHNYLQLIAISHILPDFLRENNKIKVIVLDSIAFHFRHDFEDMALRTRLLHGLVQSFMKMAHQHKLAVVFMNQMTTKISETEKSRLVPALGTSWGHACTIRIVLESIGGKRYAHLIKSPTKEEATVQFQITAEGVRDEVDPSVNETPKEHSISTTGVEFPDINLDLPEPNDPSTTHPFKRQRREP